MWKCWDILMKIDIKLTVKHEHYDYIQPHEWHWSIPIFGVNANTKQKNRKKLRGKCI